MTSQNNKPLHELDLELVKADGYLGNNEKKLADENFLTDEKLEVFSKFAFNLQKEDNSFNPNSGK